MSTKTNETLTPGNVCVIDCRFAYLHVNEPTVAKGSTKPKYNAVLIFEKSNRANLDLLKAAFAEGKLIAKTKKWGGQEYPFKLSTIVQDGDTPNTMGKARGPEFKGMYFINAKSDNRPGVGLLAGGKLVEAINPNDVKSGDYGKAQIAIYGFGEPKVGMAVGLNHILKTKEGPSLAGTAGTLKDAFGTMESAGSGLDDDFDLDSDDDDDDLFKL